MATRVVSPILCRTDMEAQIWASAFGSYLSQGWDDLPDTSEDSLNTLRSECSSVANQAVFFHRAFALGAPGLKTQEDPDLQKLEFDHRIELSPPFGIPYVQYVYENEIRRLEQKIEVLKAFKDGAKKRTTSEEKEEAPLLSSIESFIIDAGELCTRDYQALVDWDVINTCLANVQGAVLQRIREIREEGNARHLEQIEILKVERDAAEERCKLLLDAKNYWMDKAFDIERRSHNEIMGRPERKTDNA